LQGIARDLQEGTSSARIVLQRPRQMQCRIGRIELSSALIRGFQPAMVIGLVQITDYARAMAAQLDYLVELTRRPNLRLGVSPWDRPLTMHARHAFHVYDTHTVIVGTESGTAFITDPVEVGAYDRRFAELEDVAVFGDQAVHVYERVAEDYRALCRRR
jgi:Domain of unknown function (DUF5753)